ncbi:MAG: hypothetical protein IKG93_07460 [Clostridiales bacterium]|jgi:hypothetical protein|nr:hypothetical protein [Clostridiales bacterium]
MAKKLKQLILQAEKFLSDYDAKAGGEKTGQDLSRLLSYMERWLLYFQHERLIHLIVTVLFGLAAMIVLGIFVMVQSLYILILEGLLMVLLVPYIFHYYNLENGVQRLYDLIDELYKRKET